MSKLRREPPLLADDFATLLKTRIFTNDADSDVVTELYRRTAAATIGDAKMLKYGGQRWDDHELAKLCGWLRQCTQLQELSLLAHHLIQQFLDLPLELCDLYHN